MIVLLYKMLKSLEFNSGNESFILVFSDEIDSKKSHKIVDDFELKFIVIFRFFLVDNIIFIIIIKLMYFLIIIIIKFKFIIKIFFEIFLKFFFKY